MSTFYKLRGLITITGLIIILLLCNLVQMTSFFIYPFSKKTCWAVNRRIADFWWGLVALSMEHILKVNINLSGDILPYGENAILLPNHQSSADIPSLIWLARKCEMVGNLKWFVKDALKWVPGVGWGLWLLGCPFLKREWQKDKDGVIATLSQYERYSIPIWMISFLEGTRTSRQKIEADTIKTLNKGLIPLKHHLYPKRAGIVTTIQGLRSHISAVYCIEILYHGAVPTLWQLIAGQADGITLNIIRVPIELVPLSDDAIYSWVEETFHKKDRIFEEFYR